MANKKIPERSEIPVQYTWNTDDLFVSDEAWQAAFDAVQAKIPQLAAYAGRLGESAATLYEFLQLDQQISDEFSPVANYAQRKYDQDTREPRYQAMAGKVSSLMVALRSATAFELPEMMKMDDETLEQFYKDEPALELYRLAYTRMRAKREHILSDAEEKILAASGETSGTPSDIFSKLTNADLKFADAEDSQGSKHPVSNGSYVLHLDSEDRVLRKSAYESMYNGYGSMKNTLAATINGHMKQLKVNAAVRKYPNTLAAALSNTRVPEDVYHNLVSTVNANLDKMHRYVALRKKLLGVDELHMYDIYTSVVPGGEEEIPYEEAKKTVYDALAPLGEDYRKVLQEGFDNRWIDVYENVGKRSGAYSSGGSEPHPYVLLNHKDNLDSMFTLAHEMGHALHSYYSGHTQPKPYRHYVIFVAEVASTCNEALLMQYLLDKTTDKKERAFLINHYLDKFKGTLFRQTQFAEFELRMNELCAQGQPLTADLLSREYRAINEKYYGPDMVCDDLIALEWARIPHLYYNYYVYQYATGYSAAIALSRRILREGEPAVKDYLDFLSGGCSKDPIDLLKGAGVDMGSPAPVQSALDLFGELLDEMEALLKD